MATTYDFILYRPEAGEPGPAGEQKIFPLPKIAVEEALRDLGWKQVNPYRWTWSQGRTVLYLDLGREDPLRCLMVQIPLHNPLRSYQRAVSQCRLLQQRLNLKTLDLQLGLTVEETPAAKGLAEFRRARDLVSGIVKAITNQPAGGKAAE